MSGENDGSVAASRKLDTLGLSSVADNKSFKVAEQAGGWAARAKNFAQERGGEAGMGSGGEVRKGEGRGRREPTPFIQLCLPRLTSENHAALRQSTHGCWRLEWLLIRRDFIKRRLTINRFHRGKCACDKMSPSAHVYVSLWRCEGLCVPRREILTAHYLLLTEEFRVSALGTSACAVLCERCILWGLRQD